MSCSLVAPVNRLRQGAYCDEWPTICCLFFSSSISNPIALYRWECGASILSRYPETVLLIMASHKSESNEKDDWTTVSPTSLSSLGKPFSPANDLEAATPGKQLARKHRQCCTFVTILTEGQANTGGGTCAFHRGGILVQTLRSREQ